MTLRKEVKKFLIQKHNLAENLVDQNWLLLVVYLSDIFSQLNTLHQSLQGSSTMLVDISKKLLALGKS